jgi:hypothetical protein
MYKSQADHEVGLFIQWVSPVLTKDAVGLTDLKVDSRMISTDSLVLNKNLKFDIEIII